MKENMSVTLQVAILAMQIALILFSARFAGNAARKLHLPAVLGELLAGIIIGPYVLGQLCLPLHGFEQGIFPLTAGSSLPVSLPLYSLAAIGSIILLFMSGLETDLRQFFRYSVAGTAIGIGNAAIREILETLSRSHLLRESSLCEEAIFKRESIPQTTIHGGVALPHARTAGGFHAVHRKKRQKKSADSKPGGLPSAASAKNGGSRRT